MRVVAKFQRIKDIFNINIKPSKENLKKLKLAKIPLGGKEKKIASVLSSHLTNYNSNWSKINIWFQEFLVVNLEIDIKTHLEKLGYLIGTV